MKKIGCLILLVGLLLVGCGTYHNGDELTLKEIRQWNKDQNKYTFETNGVGGPFAIYCEPKPDWHVGDKIKLVKEK